MNRMNKKVYDKPTLVTRRVALGVFGDYTGDGGNGGKGGGGDYVPEPVRIITDHKLRME